MTEGNGKAAPNSRPQAMLNLRVLKALSLFASKDETRYYYLQGVCIEVEERGCTYVGTDGHRLIAYHDDLAPDDADNSLTGIFIVPTPHCKHLDKEDDGRAVLSGADAGRITIAHGLTDVTFMPIDGEYPHWRNAVPQGIPSGKLAQFNVTLLYDLRKLAKELGLSEPFIAHNGEGPAFIWFSGHPQVMGIIMPIRTIDELHREPPQWVRRGPEREQSDVEDEPLFTAEEHDPETGELPPGKSRKKKQSEPAHVACAVRAEVIRSEVIMQGGAARSAHEAHNLEVDGNPSPATSFGAACMTAPIRNGGVGPAGTLASRGAEPTSERAPLNDRATSKGSGREACDDPALRSSSPAPGTTYDAGGARPHLDPNKEDCPGGADQLSAGVAPSADDDAHGIPTFLRRALWA